MVIREPEVLSRAQEKQSIFKFEEVGIGSLNRCVVGIVT